MSDYREGSNVEDFTLATSTTAYVDMAIGVTPSGALGWWAIGCMSMERVGGGEARGSMQNPSSTIITENVSTRTVELPSANVQPGDLGSAKMSIGGA